jgi:transcriptional repressor NrdR
MASGAPLRDLDESAYLGFASIYRGWESLDDFEKVIAAPRGRHQDDVKKDAEKGARQS